MAALECLSRVRRRRDRARGGPGVSVVSLRPIYWLAGLVHTTHTRTVLETDDVARVPALGAYRTTAPSTSARPARKEKDRHGEQASDDGGSGGHRLSEPMVTPRFRRAHGKTARRRHRSPANQVRHDDLTWSERVADQVTAVFGSWGFIVTQSVMIVMCVGYNGYPALHCLHSRNFDPYPFTC